MKRIIILGLILITGIGTNLYFTGEVSNDNNIGSTYENEQMIKNISDYERSNE